MPIYEYLTTAEGCPHCQHKFEVLEKISDDAMTACPECKGPIERVLSGFAVTGKEKKLLSTKNLAEKGFTQYKKAGGGYYEKTCGTGPDVIKR
jgi:putative FmdB family regulatory protein